MVPDSLLLRHALLLGGDDVAGQHRQHGAVHGHRYRDLVERNGLEEELHVLDRVDGHAGLADVADDARMVGVVAAMGGEVERHRYALRAGGERLAIEGVGFLGGGETGVLADGPRPRRVHRRLRPAQEGLEPRQGVGVGQCGGVGRGVEGLDRQAFGRDPVEPVRVAAGSGLGGGLGPGVERGGGTSGGTGGMRLGILTHGSLHRRRGIRTATPEH